MNSVPHRSSQFDYPTNIERKIDFLTVTTIIITIVTQLTGIIRRLREFQGKEYMQLVLA